MDKLSDLQRVFNEPGTPIDFGCDETDYDEMMTRCQQIDGNKSVCVVTNWTWWDIVTGKVKGAEPICIVKADKILYDELKRFPIGGWVRTSQLIATYHSCIFETKNTFYILVGSGTRKEVSADDAIAFF